MGGMLIFLGIIAAVVVFFVGIYNSLVTTAQSL